MSAPVRITHGMMTDRLLTDIRRSNADIARTSNQISSQKRIETAADDSVGAHRALRLRSDLSETAANLAGANAAAGWGTTSDTALASVTEIVHRTRELVAQAGSDSLLPLDRQNIAKELSQLVEQAKNVANAKFGDQYVFSGQASDTPPYAPGPSDAYAGDGGAVIRTIGPGQSVQVNVAGDAIFGGAPGDGKLLDTMRNAIAFLSGGTPADANNLRTTSLAALKVNLDQVVTARSTIGATQNRVELAASRLEDVQLTLTGQRSEIEDTDLAEAITHLSSQKTAYQAALSAGANVIQPSLMDFLR